jgi:hypothetical protein
MAAFLDNNAMRAAFAQPASDGALEGEVLRYLNDLGKRRSILLLAFAPKAAGTFFRQAAMHALKGEVFRLAHAQGGRDGTPYLPNFIACCLDDALPPVIAHLHMQAFAANRHLLGAFGIRPIIMLRNIADMLASFWDMLDTDPTARAEGLNCMVPQDFVNFSRERKADFLIDIVAPWYASYFASWKSFVDETPRQVCVLRYRGFRQSSVESFHAALTHAGFVVSRSACETALTRAWSERSACRYNKGSEGRGRNYFTPRHLAELSRKLSHYPQLRAWLPDLMELEAAPDAASAAS